MKRTLIVASMTTFTVFLAFAFDAVTQAFVKHHTLGITTRGLSLLSLVAIMGALVFTVVSCRTQFIAAFLGIWSFIFEFGSIRLSLLFGEPKSWWWLVPCAMVLIGVLFLAAKSDEENQASRKTVQP